MTEHTNESLVDAIRRTENEAEKKVYLAELYQNNYFYFWKICKRYSAYENIDDLMQESFFGLWTAVERYDAKQGIPFVNYSAIWIEQTISAYIETCGHVVRVPRWMNNRIIRYEKARKKFYQENEREPSDKELADIMKLTIKQLEKIKKNALVIDAKSLDKVISTEDGDLALIDIIPDPIDRYEENIDQMDEDIKRKIIWDEVDRLKENESQVIKDCYLKGKTLNDIGKDRGCSHENIRQIRDRALSKLKESQVIQKYADDYLSATTHTGIDKTERKKKKHTNTAIQSHVKEAGRQTRRIEKIQGITLNQFRQNMTDKIMRDLSS